MLRIHKRILFIGVSIAFSSGINTHLMADNANTSTAERFIIGSKFSEEKSVTLSFDNRPPLHFIDDEGHLKGTIVSKLQCISTRIERRFSLIYSSWNGAIPLAKRGKTHGFFSASQNKERDEFATLSSPLEDQYWSWYFLKSNSSFVLSDLFKAKGKTASWLGSNTYKWLLQNGYRINASPSKPKQLVPLLLSGRIDAFFISETLIESEMEKENTEDTILKTRIAHKPLGVYFTKIFLRENLDFLTQFNDISQECFL